MDGQDNRMVWMFVVPLAFLFFGLLVSELKPVFQSPEQICAARATTTPFCTDLLKRVKP